MYEQTCYSVKSFIKCRNKLQDNIKAIQESDKTNDRKCIFNDMRTKYFIKTEHSTKEQK